MCMRFGSFHATAGGACQGAARQRLGFPPLTTARNAKGRPAMGRPSGAFGTGQLTSVASVAARNSASVTPSASSTIFNPPSTTSSTP